jgi:hypothetical protein
MFSPLCNELLGRQTGNPDVIAEPSDTPEVAETAAALVTMAAENATHIKLVVFWPQNLALWFAQAECQF